MSFSFSILMLGALFSIEGEVRKHALPLIAHTERLEVWTYRCCVNPLAILVLCPGMNGDGGHLVANSKWQDFCRKNRLALLGLSFSSRADDLKRGLGYTFPEQGSGDVLLRFIDAEFSTRPPLLLYGFSSGAFFTEGFVELHPERVLSWCAHATGNHKKISATLPPGLISCGERDHTRFGGAYFYFKNTRATGSKTLWVGIPLQGHDTDERFEDFVIQYFGTMLRLAGNGGWVDVEKLSEITSTEADGKRAISGWLPSKDLFQQWRALNSSF